MAQLNGMVDNAPAGSLGFDADTVISHDCARDFVGRGYTFCMRYLSLGGERQRDLTAGEANDILLAGLALMPVQHVRRDPWLPTPALGESDGCDAADNALLVGFPANVNVWLDLEGVNCKTETQDIINYCNSWFDAVAAKNYAPGIYVGANCGLNSQQLYLLKFQHYMQSCSSKVPGVQDRGYQIVQTPPQKLPDGFAFDEDRTGVDQHGGAPQWLIGAA